MNGNFKQSRLHLALTSALLLATAGFGVDSFAGSASGDLNVSATVSDHCNISTSPVAFGTAYNPISGSDATTTGTVSVTCTNGTVAYVTLDEGANPAGTSSAAAPERQMAGTGANTDKLAYFLYQDNSNTVWGNTSGVGGTGKSVTGSGVIANLTVYGTIPSGQTDVHSDSYSDIVSATVTF